MLGNNLSCVLKSQVLNKEIKREEKKYGLEKTTKMEIIGNSIIFLVCDSVTKVSHFSLKKTRYHILFNECRDILLYSSVCIYLLKIGLQ